MTLSPKSKRFLQILGYLLALAGCAYVLLNPLLGVVEPIPDVLPLIGNLDDVGAVYVIWKLWPRLMDAILDFVEPELVPEHMRVENNDYIEVHAETVYPSKDGTEAEPSEAKNREAPETASE